MVEKKMGLQLLGSKPLYFFSCGKTTYIHILKRQNSMWYAFNRNSTKLPIVIDFLYWKTVLTACIGNFFHMISLELIYSRMQRYYI